MRKRPLTRLDPSPPTPLPLGRLVLIARDHGITLNEMRGHRSDGPVVSARLKAYVFLRTLGWNNTDIAREFRRDVSTIRYGLKQDGGPDPADWKDAS